VGAPGIEPATPIAQRSFEREPTQDDGPDGEPNAGALTRRRQRRYSVTSRPDKWPKRTPAGSARRSLVAQVRVAGDVSGWRPRQGSQVQGHQRVGRTQAGVGHAEFYVTAATIIPVLLAIVLFQPRALIPAKRRQGRGRVRDGLSLIVTLLVVLFPFYAEGTTVYALYLNEDSHGQRLVAFIGVTELLIVLLAVVFAQVQHEKLLKS
jgi:hypothetical protein